MGAWVAGTMAHFHILDLFRSRGIHGIDRAQLMSPWKRHPTPHSGRGPVISHFWRLLGLYSMLEDDIRGSCVWEHRRQWLIILQSHASSFKKRARYILLLQDSVMPSPTWPIRTLGAYAVFVPVSRVCFFDTWTLTMYSVIETKTSLVGIDPVRVMRTYIYIYVSICAVGGKDGKRTAPTKGKQAVQGACTLMPLFLFIFSPLQKSPPTFENCQPSSSLIEDNSHTGG